MHINKWILTGLILGNLSVFSIEFEFTPIPIDTERYESAVFADINNDGQMDIVGGLNWYEAPNWTPHKFRDVTGDVDETGSGYWFPDDMMEALDANGDGWTDILAGGFNSDLKIYVNPQGQGGGNWEIESADGGLYHNGGLWDLDGDGDTLEILSSSNGAPSTWIELVEENGNWVWKRYVYTNTPHNWGCGVGDINMDGRPDIVRPDAWYEAPEDPRTGEWIPHMIAIGAINQGNVGNQTPTGQEWLGRNAVGQHGHTVQIYVYDVNDDGLNDLMASSGHREGVFWYEQVREGDEISFLPHTIDSSWSQIHALEFADMDGDGDPDLIGGKRFKAHNGTDPMWDDPMSIYWYELRPGDATPWIRHIVTYGAGVSGATNMGIADFDGDGDLDIAATSKMGGPWILESHLDTVTVSVELNPLEKQIRLLNPEFVSGRHSGIYYHTPEGRVNASGRQLEYHRGHDH